MANETERVVEVDEGSSAPIPEPAAEIPADSGEPQSPSPEGPPPGYEGVPPELWPGKDGKPPQLTPALMKRLRGLYFTVRHTTLTCGHKMDAVNQPKTNCDECWGSFFSTHPQLVEVAHQFYQTQGRGPMVGMRGTKFVKFFERFMATLYREHLERKKQEAINGVEDSKSGSSSGDSVLCEAPAVSQG